MRKTLLERLELVVGEREVFVRRAMDDADELRRKRRREGV